MTGKFHYGAMIIFALNPIYNMIVLRTNYNVDRKNYKAFANYGWFELPMYTTIFLTTLSWIYFMMVFSTKYQPDYWIFKIKPDSW